MTIFNGQCTAVQCTAESGPANQAIPVSVTPAQTGSVSPRDAGLIFQQFLRDTAGTVGVFKAADCGGGIIGSISLRVRDKDQVIFL